MYDQTNPPPPQTLNRRFFSFTFRLGALALAAMLVLSGFDLFFPDGDGAPDRSRVTHATTLLLLADGPLTAKPAPATPPPELGSGELILNHKIVPKVTIQSGLLMQLLHTDSVTGNSFSVVTWPAEVPLRRHWHPVTERLFMLEGSISSPADGTVRAGMFWEAPPRVSMGPFTSTGSVFVFLGEGPFETYYLNEGEEAPKAGETFTVNPDTMSWQPLANIAGSFVEGRVKMLSAKTETDRAVYLVRLTGQTSPAPVYSTFGANLEGYVLSGELRLSDPYHGTQLLTPGYYFRIPAEFPSSLFTASGGGFSHGEIEMVDHIDLPPST